jgi:hypothetical protein
MKNASKYLLILCFLGAAHSVSCQSNANIPVPEYFGVYAVIDGKLLKLDGQEVHADKFATIRMGQRMGVGNVVQHQPAAMPSKNVQVPEFPADLKIVVYAQSGGLQSPLDKAKTLHLESLAFVRTLTIDTGWPNAIKRSDPENGWDSGDAAELAGIAGGEHARELEFLVKPMPGQKDIVIAGLADKLKPGVYRLTLGNRDAFMSASMQGGMLFAVQPVSQGESGKCVDALVTYAMSMSNTKYTSCAGVAVNTPSPSSVNPSGGETAVDGTVGAAFCNSYDTCFEAGMVAYKAKDWPTANVNFQAAAKQRPTSGEPWVWLGRILFMDNQPHQQADLSDVWDKALALGSQIIIGACHEQTLRPCQRGDLELNTKAVSFLANGSQAIFSAAPADITPGRILNNSRMMHISYSMKVANRNYVIDFIPLGTQGCQFNLMVQCPPDGVTKQLVLARYVSQTLTKLASGTLNALITPSNPAPGNPAATILPSSSACQAADASYALLLQGHLYKVKLAGGVGPDQRPYFFDEKGTQVTDSLLLKQLAAAVWTHDNVIESADARNGDSRVSAILGTSKALQNYSNVQDFLARGMVEALEAAVTDGASLGKAVPNLTKGVVFNQLKSAPKRVFVMAARRGLEASLKAYRQIESVPLPPADATVLNAPDLVRIKALYLQARTLELPYEALASKLMPTTASQLTNQALASAISELIPSVGLNSTEQITLNDLLNFQKSVANLSGSLPAIQAYSQNLTLALNLGNANNRTISEWATKSASTCGATIAAGFSHSFPNQKGEYASIIPRTLLGLQQIEPGSTITCLANYTN